MQVEKMIKEAIQDLIHQLNIELNTLQSNFLEQDKHFKSTFIKIDDIGECKVCGCLIKKIEGISI